MKRNIFLLFLISILSFTLIACGSNDKSGKEDEKNRNKLVEEFDPKATEYPVKITDSYDREVTLEGESGRLISLSPNITETIYAINRGAKIVGRTEFDNYPEYVEGIDSVGSLEDPDMETLGKLMNAFNEFSLETTPEKLAHVYVCLGSDDASFINGTVITVDGGWTAF